MEDGRSGSRPAGDLSFALVTMLVGAVGLVVFQVAAPAGVPVESAVAPASGVWSPMLAGSLPRPTPAARSAAEVALGELVSARPAMLRVGPRVLSEANGMVLSASVSLPAGVYDLWLGCVGNGRVQLSIFAGSVGSGSASIHTIQRDCVPVDGIYDPEAVDPVGEFPAFHPPDSAGLRGREGASDLLVIVGDRFESATAQLTALSAEPVTAAWRLSK